MSEKETKASIVYQHQSHNLADIYSDARPHTSEESQEIENLMPYNCFQKNDTAFEEPDDELSIMAPNKEVCDLLHARPIYVSERPGNSVGCLDFHRPPVDSPPKNSNRKSTYSPYWESGSSTFDRQELALKKSHFFQA
jgi:hypothetical protein